MVSSKYRNRRIGDFLKELRLTEGRNTGIPKALWALEKNGSEPLRLQTDQERSYFRATIPVNKKFIADATGIKRTGKRRNRDELRRLIISTLSEEECMSVRDLAKYMGYANITRNMTLIINELIDRNVLEYEYSDNKNNRNQRMCLK